MIENYAYKDVIHRCFRCGYCKYPQDWEDVNNCPAYAQYRMESYSSGGRLWLIRAWLNNELEWSDHLGKIVYSCAACKNCVEKCPLSFSDDIVNMVVAARSLMVEAGKIPKMVKGFLENVQKYGNPYGVSARHQNDWMEDLDLPAYSGQEYLFYVGSEGRFDSRAGAAARSVAKVMRKTGVSFGIMKEGEITDGNDVETLGEEGLLEYLAEQNTHRFKALGVQNIVTFSPHAYNVFKNTYPRFGGNFQVYHYTGVLNRAISASSGFSLPKPVRITFHDPCFLGRWNREYEAPRQLLKRLENAELVEMPRNRKSALCCGGGSGNYYTDFLGGSEDSPARIRVRMAAETGADILAVACPGCLVMLEDAVKVEGLENKIKVSGVAELLCSDNQ